MLTPITSQHFTHLIDLLRNGVPLSAALAQAIGNTSFRAGFWRFFSETWPNGGVQQWNAGEWNSHWRPFLADSFWAFGEDVFGNQLAIVDQSPNSHLWNHENGELLDLYVPPDELLNTVLENGLDWIDFYANGSAGIANQFGGLPIDMHLHWTTPLILGGSVGVENLSQVDRNSHLIGHAKLWRQISDLPPAA